jgi:hypothetical protein
MDLVVRRYLGHRLLPADRFQRQPRLERRRMALRLGFLMDFVPPVTLSPDPKSTYTRVRKPGATSVLQPRLLAEKVSDPLTEEHELRVVRRRLEQFPAALTAALQTAHALRRSISEVSVRDIEDWVGPINTDQRVPFIMH